jgi:hypothetical protein
MLHSIFDKIGIKDPILEKSKIDNNHKLRLSSQHRAEITGILRKLSTPCTGTYFVSNV